MSCRSCNEPDDLRNSKQTAVEITVGDTGCGIPANKLENIFREFEQVESAQPKTSTAPGLGLGLAVVARSVEQLGGQLRVDSKVDQGSRFSFLIPFTLWDEGRRDLMGPQGYQPPGTLVSSPSLSPSIQNPDLRMEHESEVPDDRAVSLFSGRSVVSATTSITPDSQATPSPQVVKEDVDSVGRKSGPRLLSRRKKRAAHSVNQEGITSPSRSPGRVSEPKLRILSVEVGSISRWLTFLFGVFDLDHTIRTTTSIVLSWPSASNQSGIPSSIRRMGRRESR